MEHAELHLPADVRWVSLARLIVCRSATLAGMEPARVEDLRVAVSEATTNAIMAEVAGDSSEHERVTITFGAGEHADFQVAVRDAGAGFQPIAVDVDTRDWTAESGLGITILRALADSVTFEYRDGMHVDMRFGLTLAEGTAALQRAADGTA